MMIEAGLVVVGCLRPGNYGYVLGTFGRRPAHCYETVAQDPGLPNTYAFDGIVTAKRGQRELSVPCKLVMYEGFAYLVVDEALPNRFLNREVKIGFGEPIAEEPAEEPAEAPSAPEAASQGNLGRPGDDSLLGEDFYP